ncbi:hypothetical protein DL95DRAFT_118542 [Leptodontidium sp. 2 PMI_412]|nr:hypothetical protein DL95DRAFT_118542 [Leptodontidium sp. 2 PMI_412]
MTALRIYSIMYNNNRQEATSQTHRNSSKSMNSTRYASQINSGPIDRIQRPPNASFIPTSLNPTHPFFSLCPPE